MSYKGSFTRKYLIHKLCKKNGIPDIIHLHGSEFKTWYDETSKKDKKKIRTLLSEASIFIVLGEKWKKIVKEIEPQTNTIIVRNTVHIPEESVAWDEPFKILYLGVLIYRKGVSDLLKATQFLKEEFGSEKFKIIIAGSGSEESNLRTECESLGIENIVDFWGWTDGEKKRQILKNCQLLVLPSYNEGLPMAILEAMSYGMPVIATNVGDVSSAVIDGVNGYLINPGQVESLTLSMKKLLLDPKLYQNFSDASKKLAESRFDEKVLFDALKRIYSSIAEE